MEVEKKMDHTLVHSEIPADNVEKLKHFYEEVFG
jgi:predicted enzyme related to lactoylglutathione lyase